MAPPRIPVSAPSLLNDSLSSMDSDLESKPLIAPQKQKRPERIHEHADDDDGPPPDKYNAAYWIFFLQGVGMLFPWNAFITAQQYFEYAFKDSPFEASFMNYFTCAFQVSNVICLVVVMNTQHLLSLTGRIQVPLILQVLIFGTTTALVVLKLHPVVLFCIILTFVLISGAATSFLQGGVFGLSGLLPMKYMQAVMGGQALGGVFVSLINILSLYASHAAAKHPSDQDQATINSAVAYFSISTFIVVCCIVSYWVLLRLPFVKYYLRLRSKHGGDSRKKHFKFKRIWKKIWPLALAVADVFFITLSLFPAVTASVVSMNATTSDEPFFAYLFPAVYCFLIFNVGDCLDRILAGYKQVPQPGKRFYTLVFVRTIFVPLFLLCNSSNNASWSVFHNDAFPVIFMILFSVSNGYLGSLCMMFGPFLVEMHSKEAAGAMMVLALTLGLSIGSFCSFGLKALLCACNSFVSS